MSRDNKLDVLGIFQEHGAIKEGHFKLPSGLHGSTYVQTAVILQYPNLTFKIAQAMSRKFPAPVDVVVSAAMGAIVLGQEIARQRKCRSIFFERMGGAMGLHRHFRLERGERVLVVEDILTRGRSTSEVVALSAVYGARIVGVAAIVDRSNSKLPLKIPVRALLTLPAEAVPPDHCGACARGVPLVRPEDDRTLGRGDAG
ncbi:MAG: orotate phosphoribosyltransferase [Elusimicrobiota bacterium]